MVVFAVHLDQPRLEVCADLGKDRAQPLDRIRIQHAASVLRHKDQMHMQAKDTMPAMP